MSSPTVAGSRRLPATSGSLAPPGVGQTAGLPGGPAALHAEGEGHGRVSLSPVALAVLVATVWGLCFVLIKASSPGPTPILHAGLRSATGGAVLLAWAVLAARLGPARRSGRSSPLRLPSWPVIVMLAIANSVLALGAMYLTAGRAEAAVASVLGGVQPLALAAAGWLLFGERLGRRAGTGLATAMVGVVLIASPSTGPTRLDGVALSLVAAIAPALGTIAMRRLADSVDLVVTTGLQFALGGAVLLLASALTEPWTPGALTTGLLVDLAVQGVAGTGLAYVAWFWLLARMPLVRLGPVLYLVPVVGIAASLLSGERPAPVELSGAAAVVIGAVLAAASGSRGRASTPGSDPHAPAGNVIYYNHYSS